MANIEKTEFGVETRTANHCVYVEGIGKWITQKQDDFCRFFAESLNANKALEAAGYSTKHGRSAASRLRNDPVLAQQIKNHQESMLANSHMHPSFVIEVLRKVCEYGLEGEVKYVYDPKLKKMVPTEARERDLNSVVRAATQLGHYLNMFKSNDQPTAIYINTNMPDREHVVIEVTDIEEVPIAPESRRPEDSARLIELREVAETDDKTERKEREAR